MSRLTLILTLLCCVRPAAAEDDARLDSLIRQLGSDEWSERESATDSLRHLLEKDRDGVVEARVETAREDRDPEVAGRCADLLECSPWRNILVQRGEWGRLEALDALHNTPLWSYAREGSFWSDPSTRLRRVYVSPSAGGLECLDLRSGEVLWRIDPAWTEDLSGDGRWYGHHEDRLTCVDLGNGRTLWTHTLPDTVYPSHRPYVAVDSEVAVARTWSGLCALEVGAGTVLWTAKDPDLARLWMAHGGLYSGTEASDGHAWVRRLDPRSGNVVWETRLDTTATPTSLTEVRKGEIMLWSGRAGGQAGFIGALAGDTGKVLWSRSGPSEDFQPAGDGEHGWIEAGDDLVLIRLRTGEVERAWNATSAEGGRLAWRIERGSAVIVRCDRPFKMLVVEGFDASTARTLWTSREPVPVEVDVGLRFGFRGVPTPRCEQPEIQGAGDCEVITVTTWIGHGSLVLDRRTGRVVRRMARVR